MPRRILLTLLLAACACWTGRVLAAPPVIPEEVRLRARQKVDGGYVPGLVICMVNADGRSYFSYGNLSQAPGSPPTDELALYEIASVTKTFTGVLLAQMVVAGEVSLGDTVGSLMPVGSGMPGNGGDAITLEQLANHSSGLPSTPPNLPATITDFNNQFENYGADLLYEFLDSFTLPRAPGSGFEYSNAAVGLLGHILAQSQGTDYQTLLRERVLDPLGMSDTAIDLTAGQQIRRAPGHHGVVERPPFEMNSLGAAGGLKSSAADLGNFLESNLGIGEDVLDGALPLSHQRSFNLPSGPYDLGLGWWLWDGGDLVQHGGDSFGSSAFIGFRKSTGTGVVILSNNRSHVPAGISDLGFHCLDTSEPLDAVPATAPVPEADLRRMVGDFGVLKIESLYGRPVLFIPSQRLRYTAYSNNRGGLATRDLGLEILIDPNSAMPGGDIVSLDYRQNGVLSVFERIRHPGRLSIVMGGRGLPIQLTVEGEGDREYSLEHSTDLKDWQPAGKINRWDGREEAVVGDEQYFRLGDPMP